MRRYLPSRSDNRFQTSDQVQREITRTDVFQKAGWSCSALLAKRPSAENPVQKIPDVVSTRPLLPPNGPACEPELCRQTGCFASKKKTPVKITGVYLISEVS
jgi:hypothetical protein